jgi:hypothetical protein
MEETKKSITIDGEIITVGDKIRWMNISLNAFRQGKVTDITDAGIFVTQDNRFHTKLHIRPPYEDKCIFTL